MGKSQHILTGGDDKKAARAHAPMKQRDVKARPDQPAERTPPTGGTPGPRSRETGACGKPKAGAAACKASRLGWEGAVLRRGFLSSGDFWNQANVPHA